MEGDAWLQRLSGLPLLAQPGEDWLYGTGSSIQGGLVARASGQSLSRFCEERILRPLRMKDIAYFVPSATIERLAHAYRSEGDRLVLFDEPATGKWSRPALGPSREIRGGVSLREPSVHRSPIGSGGSTPCGPSLDDLPGSPPELF